MGTKPRLFVSHHSSKAVVALHVEKALAVHGVDCWIAPRDVEPGEAFDDAIMRAIGQSDAVLLLFCSESDKSPHVKRELILADGHHKAIIPLRLEQIVPVKLAYHLANSQWIDWLEQRDIALRRIADKARQLAGPVPPEPEPSERRASVVARPVSAPPPTATQFVQPPRPSGKSNTALAAGIGLAVLCVLVLVVLGMAAGQSDRTVADELSTPPAMESAIPLTVETLSPVAVSPPVAEPTQAAFSPSFDCANASGSAETLICNDPSLARLDNEMASAYRDLLSVAGDVRGEIESDQGEWLRTERNACSDTSCLGTAMRQRILVIGAARQLVLSGSVE